MPAAARAVRRFKIDLQRKSDFLVTHFIQAILTVLSLVNPLICATMFAQAVRGKPPAARTAKATQAMAVVAVILALAALTGAQLLSAFSISIPAFQTAGGLVLAWMGFTMLRGNSSPTSSPAKTAADGAAKDAPAASSSLTPLILFAASPGTITGVITLSVTHSKFGVPLEALVAIAVVLSLTFAIMLAAGRLSGDRKPGFVHDVTTRFMGLIVLAMGVQFALTGLADFFHA